VPETAHQNVLTTRPATRDYGIRARRDPRES
jgi:hypothetical protein